MRSTDKHSAQGTVHRRNPLAVALVLAIATFMTGTTIAWLAGRQVADQIEREAIAQLRVELGFRKSNIIDYLDSVGRNLENIASSRISRTIVQEFVNAIDSQGDTVYSEIRQAYLFDNPNPEGHRQALLSARDGSQYSRVHARYHDWLLKLANTHDYYDLFLTDSEGNIVYSVFKEDDFGTSLVSGDYRDTELANTFERVRNSLNPEQPMFSDFVDYAPSGNLPAAFIGSPILLDGKFGGALLAQLKQPRLNMLLGGKRDSGASVEMKMFLVGADGMLRAGTGVPTDRVLRTPFDSRSATAALSNGTGVMDAPGFQGEDALLAYSPLRWNSISWGIIAERPRSDIEQPLVELRLLLFPVVLLCTLLAFVCGWLLADRDERVGNAISESL